MDIKQVSEIGLSIWILASIGIGIIPAIPKKNYTVMGIWALAALAGLAVVLYLAA